jgi:antitoxin CptB
VTPFTEMVSAGVGEQARADRGRLRWRCRRGMKELDVLLERFAHRALAQAGEAERQALAELLALGDPQLAAYLLGGQTPAAPHLALLVGRIRSLCRSGGPLAVF